MMNLSLVLFTSLFLTHYNAHILRLPECGKYDAIWTVLYEGQKLIGAVHTVLSSLTLRQCLKKCMLYRTCKSVSVHSEENLCMIHNSRNGENGTSLETVTGWDHMETDPRVENLGPTCNERSPCGGGRQCEDTCTDKGYTCLCRGTDWILQATGMCVSGKDGVFGEFSLTQSGVLVDLKLQHVGTSTLKCFTTASATNWGCGLRLKNIGVVVTDDENNIIIPDQSLLDRMGEFTLAGFDANSDHIVYSDYSKTVLSGQKMRIWYSQDLLNVAKSDNSGQSCADVYAKFC